MASPETSASADVASRRTIGPPVSPPDPYAQRIDSDTGRRILTIARALVAERGVDGTHIVEIARRAGIARGLVNYYFGSKSRLLGEVLDADAAERLERLRECTATAQTLDELVRGLGSLVDDYLRPDRGRLALQELATLALHDDDIAERLARSRARYRAELAEILVDREQAGVVQLQGEPAAVAAMFVAIGQGIITEQLADATWDHVPTARYAMTVARCVLDPAG